MGYKFNFVKWAACFAFAACPAVSQQSLSNEAILRLVRAQLGDDVIVRLIASQPGQYITTPDALVALKQAGASNTIIAAIVNRTDSVFSGSTTDAVSRDFNPRLRQIRTRTTEPVILENGTAVSLRLLRTLSSASANVGDPIHLEVLDNVYADDRLVIPRGAKVLGSVRDTQRNRRLGVGGKLGFSIDWVQLPDGSKIPLRAESRSSARSGEMVIKAPIAWSTAPFVVLKGKQAVLPRGSEITAYTDDDVSAFADKTDRNTSLFTTPRHQNSAPSDVIP